MATYIRKESDNSLLGVIIGLLIAAAVAAGVYFFFFEDSSSTVNIQTPAAESTESINIEPSTVE